MKIVYVTESFPNGPGESFIAPEIRCLRSHGLEISLFPIKRRHDRPLATDLEECCVQEIKRVAKAPERLATWKLVFSLLRAAPRIIFWVLQTRNVKLMIKNLMVVPKSISLAGYVVKAKVEHIHAHWAAYTCTVALFASRITGVPYSFTAHRYDIVLNNLLDLKIQNASFSRFVSRSGVALAGRAAHHPNVRVIHMGVNVPESVPQRVFRKTGSFVILCPASFVPVKGHKYLLEAIRVLRDKAQGFEVWLAGTGPLLQYISHYIEAHSLGDCVKLLGHVPHPELLRLYDEGVIDAVVLSSTDLGNGLHEGVPVSLMEAMARAIPVVSTCTGGIPELLGGGAGILVEDKSPFAIAKALLRLMNSPKLGHVVGLRGYRRVQEKFWIDRIAIDLIKAFRASARRTNGMEDAVPDDNTIVSMDR